MCFSPARDLPQQSLYLENSLAPEMMDSETPPRASPPQAADDTEVLSQRMSGQEEVVLETPQGETPDARLMGGRSPWIRMRGAQ